MMGKEGNDTMPKDDSANLPLEMSTIKIIL
jgi:hypothetical protein